MYTVLDVVAISLWQEHFEFRPCHQCRWIGLELGLGLWSASWGIAFSPGWGVPSVLRRYLVTNVVVVVMPN